MDWTPEWEPLAEALKRVIGAGTLPEVAKHRICTDIAQDRIRVRLYVASDTPGKPDVGLKSKKLYRVPSRLEPSDFEWENSRPSKPWSVNRTGDDYGREDITITFIELNTDDVIYRLCSSSDPSIQAQTESSAKSEGNKRSHQSDGDTKSAQKRTRGRPPSADKDLKREIGIVIAAGYKAQSIYREESCAKIAKRLLEDASVKGTRFQSTETIEKILRGVYPSMSDLDFDSAPFKKRA
jgi:hypothetical protein